METLQAGQWRCEPVGQGEGEAATGDAKAHSGRWTYPFLLSLAVMYINLKT